MGSRYLPVLILFLRSLFAFGQQDTVELYIPDTTILLGNTATIEVRVNNFEDILSMQASINWDPNLLTFSEVSGFGLQDLGANNFGTTNAELGHIRFVWEPADVVAKDLPDSSFLFLMTFEYNGTQPVDINIDFEDKVSTPAFPVEFANSNYNLLTVRCQEGTVTYYQVITGLQDEILKTVVYPNPFKDSFFVTNDSKEIDYITVYNQVGELIKEIRNPDDILVNVPISSNSAGIYIVNLNKNGRVFTKKLVKNLY